VTNASLPNHKYNYSCRRMVWLASNTADTELENIPAYECETGANKVSTGSKNRIRRLIKWRLDNVGKGKLLLLIGKENLIVYSADVVVAKVCLLLHLRIWELKRCEVVKCGLLFRVEVNPKRTCNNGTVGGCGLSEDIWWKIRWRLAAQTGLKCHRLACEHWTITKQRTFDLIWTFSKN
jgi:hypothetical protein